MHRMKRVMCWMTTVVAVFGIGRSVQAEVLTVDNADFDETSVPAAGYTYTLGSWVTAGDGGAGSGTTWISNGYYNDESTPNSSACYTTIHNVHQALTHTFVAGMTYTFAIDIGGRANGPYNWRVYIYNATSGSYASPLAEVSGSITASAAGSDPWNRGEAVVLYTATPADAGNAIGIGFGGPGTSYYTLYDNATVESAVGGTAPSISLDPQDQTIVLGDPAAEATFSVSAVGSTPLNYQWRLGGTPISGATNATLTLTGAGESDVGDYDAIVGNAFGSATSQSASLSLTIPGINPAAQAVVFGGTANVAIDLPGTGYAYQWTFDGGDISGATASDLEIAGALLSDTGEYAVVVSLGGVSLTSEVATLDVTIPLVEPAAKVTLVGDTTTFSVTLPGTGYAYQWKKGGVSEPGATRAFLTLTSVAEVDSGDYTLDVTLGGETVTAGPTVFTVAPLPTEAYATVVNSDGPLAYWRLGESVGAMTAVDQTGSYDATYQYATNAVLGTPGVTLGDTDTSVSFTGDVGSQVEAFPLDPADLNPTVFSVEFWAQSIGGSGWRSPVASQDDDGVDGFGWSFYAAPDNVWEFWSGRGTATGDTWNVIEGPTVNENQWTHLAGTYDGTDLTFYVNGALVGTIASADFTPQDYNPLWIGAGATEDLSSVGNYFWVGNVDEVALFDRALSAQEVIDHYAAAFAAPIDPPEITVAPTGGSRIAGEIATFDVGVHSTPPVTYQWQVDGVDIPGATERVLTLPGDQAVDGGMYRAKVGNTFGFAFSDAAELEICSGTCDIPVLNGGFDDATGVLADFWNDNGGTLRGGDVGGFGWTEGYYTGGFPTDNTFGTTLTGPIRQDLAGRSFVEGATYTLTVDLFSSDTYGASAGATMNWRIALTADGETVAEDVWYSDEFVTAGETVPPGRLISVTPSGGPGLTTATLQYTAAAADAGKALGIELGGDLTLGDTTGDDYYGHMDSVQLTAETSAATATMNLQWVAGQLELSWDDETGTLQEVEDLDGAWSDVPGAASPVIVMPTTPRNNWRLRE